MQESQYYYMCTSAGVRVLRCPRVPGGGLLAVVPPAELLVCMISNVTIATTVLLIV